MTTIEDLRARYFSESEEDNAWRWAIYDALSYAVRDVPSDQLTKELCTKILDQILEQEVENQNAI